MGTAGHLSMSGIESVMEALWQQVDRAEDVVYMAVAQEQQDFLERQRAAAADHPQWSAVAPHFRSGRDDDGNYIWGVDAESSAYDRAHAAEFGGQDQAPTAFVRMGTVRGAADISANLNDTFRRAGL